MINNLHIKACNSFNEFHFLQVLIYHAFFSVIYISFELANLAENSPVELTAEPQPHFYKPRALLIKP